jgi:translation elongation factor P/translation initiation factor 5A
VGIKNLKKGVKIMEDERLLEVIAENLCKSGFEQSRSGTNYLSICEQLELYKEIQDEAGVFVCKRDKQSWEDDVRQFLHFNIQADVTLNDIIDFYLKYRNYIQGNCHICNKVIFNSNDSRIIYHSTGKDIYFCDLNCYTEYEIKRDEENIYEKV